jgi:CubicO group peptidase (beta-lactamase class C family)
MSCGTRGSTAFAAIVFGAAMLGTFATSTAAQRQTGKESIDQVVAQALDQSDAPGAIIAVVTGDSVAFLRAFGRARFSADSALDTRALFRVGNVTELINGIAAAALAAGGKLKLNAPIGSAIPELPSSIRRVTMAQLLSHTAGLAYRPAVPGRGGANNLGAAARQLTYLDVFAEPGAIHSPSPSGASLVGLVIERAAGVPYAAAIRTTVLRPLGMQTATLDFQTARPTIATGHAVSTTPETPILILEPRPDSSFLTVPREGLFASAHDLARLSVALLNAGQISGQQALPRQVITDILATRAIVPGSVDEQIGLGTKVSRWEGRREIRLAGSSPGHSFLIRLLPDQRLGVIVLTNMSGPRGTLGGVDEFVLRRQLSLPMPTRAAPQRAVAATPGPKPSTPTDLAGTYRNGGEEIELRAEGGKLRARTGNILLDVQETRGGGFVANVADGRPALGFNFNIVRDSAGRPYIWMNQRALGRTRASR